jgi:hypothetical protein
LVPIIVGSWPAIAAAAAGAAAALSYSVAHGVAEEDVSAEASAQSAEVELRTGELAEALATGQEITVTRGTVKLTVSRDARGGCRVCAAGLGHSKVELERMAKEFADQMTQCFVYNRVMTELRAKGLKVVDEEKLDDQSIRIHVRNWGG